MAGPGKECRPLNPDNKERSRMEPIGRCDRCAKLLGHKYFALQNGDECFTSSNKNFARAESDDCVDDGRGGKRGNMLYERKCKYQFNII